MMGVETVILLGAGASAADGAPLQNSLFTSYFQGANSGGQINEELRRFFHDFFGIDTDGAVGDAQFPTFEEILGIVELALNRGESFKDYSLTQPFQRIQDIRQQIILLIGTILKERLDGSARTAHNQLVQRLLDGPEDIRRTAFISLNYDILIDNALTDQHPQIHLDYGVRFSNPEADRHEPSMARAVRLFKLHGSLNWLYCPTCISLTITPGEKSSSTIAENPRPCVSCGTHMIPIIIPPTFFKVMSNYFLQQIWRQAEQTLTQCSTLVICGYSFSDADIHIKYLLKRVEVNRGNTPNIFIYNSHPRKSGCEKEEEKKKYQRFFRDKSKVHYLDKSFEDFCENGVVD